MTDDTSNLILSMLRRMDERLEGVERDMKDVKAEVHALRLQVHSLEGYMLSYVARADERFKYIEGRLALRDPV